MARPTGGYLSRRHRQPERNFEIVAENLIGSDGIQHHFAVPRKSSTSLFTGNVLFDEFGESACLCARLSSRRKHCPQPHRWQRPILKHGYRRPRFQFRREQPFRAADGHSEAGEHPLPNTLRRADPETAAYSDGDFGRSLAKDPRSAAGASLLINDGLMRDELTGGLRHAVRFEIRVRADHERSALSDFARGES